MSDLKTLAFGLLARLSASKNLGISESCFFSPPRKACHPPLLASMLSTVVNMLKPSAPFPLQWKGILWGGLGKVESSSLEGRHLRGRVVPGLGAAHSPPLPLGL